MCACPDGEQCGKQRGAAQKGFGKKDDWLSGSEGFEVVWNCEEYGREALKWDSLWVEKLW